MQFVRGLTRQGGVSDASRLMPWWIINKVSRQIRKHQTRDVRLVTPAHLHHSTSHPNLFNSCFWDWWTLFWPESFFTWRVKNGASVFWSIATPLGLRVTQVHLSSLFDYSVVRRGQQGPSLNIESKCLFGKTIYLIPCSGFCSGLLHCWKIDFEISSSPESRLYDLRKHPL